eukprot:CAMPEP_0119320762 /NCGR_PEP_ID=MMETSP1333-20130426/53324_1 /TAXON_ID=418940 /ORGANISM="Scyphosphaera apsteinii, Strain RCC1455" /LENGTH=304 /DNA_ID=CAMNT_0007327547 /DNA_START=228 /DNA_END=1142 /DNA_ORIENTATION=+
MLLVDTCHLWRYLAPAFLYAVQNNLNFVGVSNLSAAAFQVTNQLRIPVTAVLMRLLLRKQISIRQAVAIVLLLIGVILVQLQRDDTGSSEGSSHERKPLVGLGAVLVCVTCSAFAGVWFERVLKYPHTPDAVTPTIWASSIALGLCSLPFAFGAVWIHDRHRVVKQGLFQGFDQLTLLVLVMGSLGGILVALTFKVADNLIKTFATAIALVVSCQGSWLLFHTEPPPQFIFGVTMVLSATLLYSLDCASLRNGLARTCCRAWSQQEAECELHLIGPCCVKRRNQQHLHSEEELLGGGIIRERNL